MTKLLWDQTGERRYENGVRQGVLYVAEDGVYGDGKAWNGLTTITESPSGAEATPQYADDSIYLNLVSLEKFGGTIEAFTYPLAFEACDGSAELTPGVTIGQQNRSTFGLCYRTNVGLDTDPDAGYKLHLVYGALAGPSEKARATVNETPEAIGFSWPITTTPVQVTGFKATSHLVVDSTQVDAGALSDLEDILYGTVSDAPRLPLPDEVGDLVGATVTVVDLGVPANQPTYNAGTHVITLPAVTGVVWKINGAVKASGAQPALTVGQVAMVAATPADDYSLTGSNNWSFDY